MLQSQNPSTSQPGHNAVLPIRIVDGRSGVSDVLDVFGFKWALVVEQVLERTATAHDRHAKAIVTVHDVYCVAARAASNSETRSALASSIVQLPAIHLDLRFLTRNF